MLQSAGRIGHRPRVCSILADALAFVPAGRAYRKQYSLEAWSGMRWCSREGAQRFGARACPRERTPRTRPPIKIKSVATGVGVGSRSRVCRFGWQT